ncbi:MAG: hypothetical protein K0S29_374 [Gammaproteobacteria bacterium]|jgi:hypothetical protein|nr:hypothetical protein [Gammaproteobacteria bacterium]
MSKSLGLISEIGEGKNKALLLELPQELAMGLSIQTDGRVNTRQLLDLFAAVLCQEEHCSTDDNLSIHEKIELFLNIYDSDRPEK